MPSAANGGLTNHGLGLERAIENPSWIDGPLTPDFSNKAKPMATFKRKKLFVDPKVQGAFLARILLYWFLCLVASGTALIAWMLLTGGPRVLFEPFTDFWPQFAPAVVVSSLMLPILMFDCVRLTNRFAGPMFRVRREMRNLADGTPTHSIHLRTGDFWMEFADEFNAVRQRIILLEERLDAKSNESTPEPVEQTVLDDMQELRTTIELPQDLVQQISSQHVGNGHR